MHVSFESIEPRQCVTGPPAFDAHHILFSAVPVRWVNSRPFRTLYGDDDYEMSEDRMSKTNYTIFLRKTPERPPGPSPRSLQRYELRYFGNTVLWSDEKDEAELRGLELIPPGESYTEALGTTPRPLFPGSAKCRWLTTRLMLQSR